MIDYTKLLDKIDPQPGGEDTLRLRTGIVDAINVDGTLDVEISKVVVPNVPRMDNLVVAVGQSVQVLSYRGALLVMGRSATSSVGTILRARKSATTTRNTNTTTLLDDPHLFVTPKINTAYAFRGYLQWMSGTTPDIKFFFSLPASSSLNLMWTVFNRAASISTQIVQTSTMLQGETLVMSGAGTTFSTQSQWVSVTGQVATSGTAGNITLQWQKNAGDTTDTSLVLGSWMELTELPA